MYIMLIGPILLGALFIAAFALPTIYVNKNLTVDNVVKVPFRTTAIVL